MPKAKPAPVLDVPKAKRGTGRVSIAGRLPTTPKEDTANPLVPVLIRVPAKLLDAFDAHLVGVRSAAIAALIAEATQQAQSGGNIDLQAGSYAHWYTESSD